MADFFLLQDGQNVVQESQLIDGWQSNLCKSIPCILDLLVFLPPLSADDLGDLGVREARMTSYNRGLKVLPIQHESYELST